MRGEERSDDFYNLVFPAASGARDGSVSDETGTFGNHYLELPIVHGLYIITQLASCESF